MHHSNTTSLFSSNSLILKLFIKTFQNRTREMISRREQLLVRPWEVQRYENHKRKVKSAKPTVDVNTPPTYSHVKQKLKKLQAERERLEKIRKENIRLLQRLGEIMRTKRLENIWTQPRPNFLNREKLFITRPKTCKGRIETVITTPPQQIKQTTRALSGRSAIRCDACSGRPIKKNQVIPEERIPWTPPRKSWNIKICTEEFETYRCCKVCGKEKV